MISVENGDFFTTYANGINVAFDLFMGIIGGDVK